MSDIKFSEEELEHLKRANAHSWGVHCIFRDENEEYMPQDEFNEKNKLTVSVERKIKQALLLDKLS